MNLIGENKLMIVMYCMNSTAVSSVNTKKNINDVFVTYQGLQAPFVELVIALQSFLLGVQYFEIIHNL